MSSLYETYCNTTTDLQDIADVSVYDRKRVLPNNFVESGVSNLYYLHDSGFCSTLYMDGAEQTYVSDTPNAMNEWTYQAASDRLDVYIGGSSVADMNSRNWEESEDFATLKQKAVDNGADEIRSYLQRSIYPIKNTTYQGSSERNYDFILVRINALLAVSNLMLRTDPEKSAEIRALAINDETGQGLLDKLRKREYSLWNETTAKSENGIIQIVSQSGTGGIGDIKMRGPVYVDYDEVRVVVSTAGTVSATYDSTPTAKFDVYVKNEDGLKRNKVIEDEVITGAYQGFVYGSDIQFSVGTYSLNDEFAVTFRSSEVAIGSVRSGQIYRV
mgnify:CR=1 FL=1|tara:strand:- start:2997 stop:3983 length:987 start_codon:yes stop_codon:yes gene_type:complete